VKDILSAVDYAKARASINPQRIYLAGASGGGHAALLMAGRAPTVWAAVSAWVPVTDLKAWHAQCIQSSEYARYVGTVEACCGGKPGAGPAVDEQYRKRSPVTWLSGARNLPLDINTGIHDGHRGSVPVSHALRAFNSVAAEADRLTDADIDFFVTREAVPPALARPIEDPTYGEKAPLFRRTSNKVRITVFEGGHEIVLRAAMSWLERQVAP
jgi:acetyl esterase/lipase